MKAILSFTLFFSIVLSATAQKNSFDYFGLPSPGHKIELFAPGIVSLENSKEYSLAISPLGDEVFFAVGTWPECKIMHMKKTGNEWGEPQVAVLSSDCYGVEPAFSPDGKYLFFSSSKGMDDINNYSIWRFEKLGKEWGNAIKVTDNEDPEIWEFHPSVSNDGTVFFCRWDSKTNKGKIYKSEYKNGSYSEPIEENIPFQGNCSVTNPFIDPDKKFIITSTETETSKNNYDVFISYRENEKWTDPVNFGNRFNTPEVDDSFDISPDGRFLFIYKQDDIFWIEKNGIFKNIKTGN